MPQNGREALLEQIAEIADRVAGSEGLEIVELELLGGGKQRVLRLFIDKPEGVTHGDCEVVSNKLGAVLDAEDIIPGDHYTLEVSSPGVERKLTKAADFQRFAGQKAKIVMHEPIEDQKYWEGTLRGVEGNHIVIEPSEGRLVHIPLTSVKRANLKFEW